MVGTIKQIIRRILNKPLVRRGMEIVNEFGDADVSTHAASAAYFFFLSLIPLVVIYVNMVSWIGITQDQIIELLRAIVPEMLGRFIERIVVEAYSSPGIALSLSLITLLWSAAKGMGALAWGLDSVYGRKGERSRIIVNFISIGYLVVLLLLISALIYLVFSGEVRAFLSNIFPGLQRQGTAEVVLSALLVDACGTVIFAVGYSALPSGKRKLRSQLPGAFFASTAWLALSLGFRVYMHHVNRFTLFYGSLTTVALFIFWLYLIFYIMMLGGFLNHQLECRE